VTHARYESKGRAPGGVLSGAKMAWQRSNGPYLFLVQVTSKTAWLAPWEQVFGAESWAS
jgi:hypothetical protein